MSERKGMGIAIGLSALAALVIGVSPYAALRSDYVYSISASRDTYTYGLLASAGFLGLFLIFLNLAVRIRAVSQYSLSPMALAAGPVALLATIAAMDAWALPATDSFLVSHPLVNTTVVFATSYGLPAAILMGSLLASVLLRSASVSSPRVPQDEGAMGTRAQ